MESTGGADFSDETKKDKIKKPAQRNVIELTSWPSFLLTLAGVAGMISMLFDGPLWITYSGFTIVIGILFWIIIKSRQR